MKAIKLRWNENGDQYDIQINGLEFKNLMWSHMNIYTDNNKISTKLYSISDKITVIEVDKDFYNREQVLPFKCYVEGQSEPESFEVDIYKHPVILAMFLELCRFM